MTRPVPVRTVEAVRVTRPDGEVVETVRTVEFATPSPASPVDREGRELPGAGVADICDCVLHTRGWRLDSVGEARRALPPGSPAPTRGWLRWWWR